MNNKIFIDTGGWIACIDKNDKHYQIATEYFNTLREENIPLVATNYILDETLTWIKYHLGHDKAVQVMKLWKEAEKSNLLTIYWIDKNIADEAWKIFRKYKEHTLSFTDCTSFAICRKYNIKRVFSFDKDFNTLGFLLSPYQIHEDKVEYDVLRP